MDVQDLRLRRVAAATGEEQDAQQERDSHEPILIGFVLGSAGGVGAPTWTLAAGTPPAGLKLDARTGVVSGTARRPGRFRFTIVVADSLGAKAAMTYTLRVKR
jgi:hypothetical protein